MKTKKINPLHHLTALFIALVMLYSPLGYAQIKAGSVTDISGTVWAQVKDQPRRKLQKNSPVYAHDLITTDARSNIKMKMRDNTRFELGPEARFKIKDFKYEQEDEEDSMTMSILKGAFRFVSGFMAKKKPRSMSVSTSVATIGIRGTSVAGEVNATSATIILMEPDDPSIKTAIDVSNEFGSVTIDEPGYGTEIPDEFSPPSPPRRMRLQTINNIMRSMQSIQRMNVPRPRMH